MLQYITDAGASTPVAQQILKVIDGGCRWIQIKMDDASDDEIRKVVEAVMPTCIEKEVFLILNDRVDLAKELNVGGVHLEKGDIPPSKARMDLGPAAVIGVSVHTLADVLAVSALDIDYFTLTPYADATNPENALGVDGVKAICKGMLDNQVTIPHVAAGGIRFEDVAPLLTTGVNGLAVSKAIAEADDIEKETRKFVDALPLKEGN